MTKLLLAFRTLLITSLFIYPMFSYADTPPPTAKIAPEANAILEKLEEATHIQKVLKFSNVMMKYNLIIHGSDQKQTAGKREITTTKDQVHIKLELGNNIIQYGYNTQFVWGKDSITGKLSLKKYEQENCIRNTLTNISNIRNYYDEILLEKQETFHSEKCYVLICKKTGVTDRKLYIQKTSYLPLGFREIQIGIPTETYHLEFLTTKEGFILPRKAELYHKDTKVVTFILTEVLTDQTINPQIFEEPKP